MVLSLSALSGSIISLDLRKEFGERVELAFFQFVVPPIEFRLVRNQRPLQIWQSANTDVYDLQHCPRVKRWERDSHWFINDLDHRPDVRTCGVRSEDLGMQTRGLGLNCVLLVWLREGTFQP